MTTPLAGAEVKRNVVVAGVMYASRGACGTPATVTMSAPGYPTGRLIVKSVLTPSPVNTSAGMTVLAVTAAADPAACPAQYLAEKPLPSTVPVVFCAQSAAKVACV